MKWHRVKPGQYELRDSEGTRWGIIERSSLMWWWWWWSVWGPDVYATGGAGMLAIAKLKADEARLPRGG